MEHYLGGNIEFPGPLGNPDEIIPNPMVEARGGTNSDENYTLHEESSSGICTADPSSQEPWPRSNMSEFRGSSKSASSYTQEIEPSFTCWNINLEKTEPVSRDEFNQYHQHVEETIQALRKERDEFQALYSLEREKSKCLDQQIQERVSRSKRLAAENRTRWEANVDLRGNRNEPIWPPVNSESSNTHRTSSLLYDNALDAAREVKARSLLIRASIAIDQGDLDKAESLVADALVIAKKLDYIPFEAKCKYWEAAILNARGRYEEAARVFVQARPCVGKYIEGEDVERWLKHYQRSKSNSPTETYGSPVDGDDDYYGDGGAGRTLVDRGRRRRRVITAAADMPVSP